METTDVYDDNY